MSNPRLPLAAYGACTLSASVAAWLGIWPETAWAPLPDTLEEGEAAAGGASIRERATNCSGGRKVEGEEMEELKDLKKDVER